MTTRRCQPTTTHRLSATQPGTLPAALPASVPLQAIARICGAVPSPAQTDPPGRGLLLPGPPPGPWARSRPAPGRATPSPYPPPPPPRSRLLRKAQQHPRMAPDGSKSGRHEPGPGGEEVMRHCGAAPRQAPPPAQLDLSISAAAGLSIHIPLAGLLTHRYCEPRVRARATATASTATINLPTATSPPARLPASSCRATALPPTARRPLRPTAHCPLQGLAEPYPSLGPLPSAWLRRPPAVASPALGLGFAFRFRFSFGVATPPRGAGCPEPPGCPLAPRRPPFLAPLPSLGTPSSRQWRYW